MKLYEVPVSSISIADYKAKYAKPRRTKRRVSVKKERVVSEGEATLVQHLKTYNIEFQTEFKFNPERKWRADFYIVGSNMLIEVEGGIWSNGRHTRAQGYLGDMEKYNSAQVLGYSVYRYSTEQVKSGKAIDEIRRLIG
nr:endonuclease domain-containing protein [Acinetobacter defluvii]